MTATAPPVERQNNWIVTKDKDGNIIQAATVLGNSPLIVYKNRETWCMVSRAFGVRATLKTATTPGEAIFEAVAIIAQHLAQLSAELGAIPITLS